MYLYPQVDSCKRGSFSPGKNYNPQIIAPNSPGKNYFPQILSRLERDAQAQERQGGALMPYRSALKIHFFLLHFHLHFMLTILYILEV